MSEFFTPGPWSLLGRLTVVAGQPGVGVLVTIADTRQLPCIGGHDDMAAQRACDQEQANAKLIAAAPDLLAALQAYIGSRGYGETDSPVEQQARAAISKATT